MDFEFEKIKSFDLEKIKSARIILLIGDQVEFIKDEILKRQKNITVFSNDDQDSRDHLTKLIDEQRAKSMQMRENIPYHLIDFDSFPMTIHFKNCLSESNWMKDMVFKEIFMNGRHYNINVLVSEKFPIVMPPELRYQLDYIFVSSFDHQNHDLKKFYMMYFGIFENFKKFQEFFHQILDNHHLMVYDLTFHSENIMDKIYYGN